MQSITLFSRRPQRITTEEFGRSLSYEKVKLTTASVKQAAQFIKIMENGFNSIIEYCRHGCYMIQPIYIVLWYVSGYSCSYKTL